MVDSFVLLNDGTSFVLLNDGSSKVILNGAVVPAIGLTISGTHATQAFYGARPEQLIPVEFTFRIKSCLITLSGTRVCVKAALRILTKASMRIKSLLIVEVKNSVKIKSSLLLRKQKFTMKLDASHLVPENYRIGLFANTDISKRKKIKEFLLRKLKEMSDNG